jgi:hypothetical protein
VFGLLRTAIIGDIALFCSIRQIIIARRLKENPVHQFKRLAQKRLPLGSIEKGKDSELRWKRQLSSWKWTSSRVFVARQIEFWTYIKQ